MKKIKKTLKNTSDNNSLTFIIVLIIAYLCIFKIDYRNNPKNISFLGAGIVLILFPIAYYIVQKIQLYLIKKRFNNDEYIICETVFGYPRWFLYIMIPGFLGICLGSIITIILHPEVHFRRLNSENISFAIIVMVGLLYLCYQFVLRIKTVLTNYGLRSNYKYDTLFSQTESIQEETTDDTKILKAYKNCDKQIKANKIPKIYNPTNDKIDNITGSLMQNYEKTKIKILEAYELYKTNLQMKF